MSSPLILDLDAETSASLDRYCDEQGVSPEDAVRDMIRRRLLASDLRRLQEEIEPFAKRAGVSEEDILRDVS